MSDEEGYLSDDGSFVAEKPSPEALALEQQRREEAAAAARENALLLEAVPDPVKKFVLKLHAALSSRNQSELQQLYEKTYPALSNDFYKAEEWPRAEVVSSLVRNDEVFLTLYRDLYFRHLYSRFAANIDLDDRFDSYENYCNLFNYVLNSEGPVPIDLPAVWISDIVDEFIWQFGAFAAWRSKIKEKTEDEIVLLEESPLVWSCYSVLNVLYSLVQKSKIQESLKSPSHSSEEVEADEYASKPLYRLFGYFSLLGLLRVHVLLGDYTLALMTLDDVDLKSMVEPSTRFHAVHSAHVSTFYYVGFAYLMMRRYNDAVDVLSRGVSHFHKNRRFTFGADQVAKSVDRMLALIAMAHALSASSAKLEDWVKQGIQDKYADASHRINRSTGATTEEILETYEDLFFRACPKFVTPIAPALPNLDEDEDAASMPTPNDPTKHQWLLFQSDVKSLLGVSDMRSFLKLYTTLSTDKMASLLGRSEEEVGEELAVVKGALRSFKWTSGSLLEGEYENTGDVAFSIEDGTITISEARKARQVADYFLRRTLKAHEQLQQLKHRPLPATKSYGQTPAKTSGQDGAGKTVAWAAARA